MTDFNPSPLSNSALRVGLIGFGAHMRENLYPALRLAKGVHIAAIASRDGERARALASEFGIARATSRWQELIETGEVDALVVSATPKAHQEIALASVNAGLPVFIEKPPAPDMSSLRELARAERQAGETGVFVDYNFRYGELVQRAADLIKPDAQLRCLKLRFVAGKPLGRLWDCASIKESYLYAVGIHAIDLAITWLGEPQSIDVSHVALGDERFSLTLTLGFAGGRRAVLDLGNYSNRFESRCELIGENGRVAEVTNLRQFSFRDPARPSALSPKSAETYEVSGLQGGFTCSGYSNAFQDFFQALRAGAPSPSPAHASLPVYEVIAQCLDALT